MDNGWEQSARAWIEAMGEEGDWGRAYVLDPAMLSRLSGRTFRRALDIGCGEGRFCRVLKSRGISAVGIDPTRPLIEQAVRRDPAGAYCLARAEELPFADAGFDLVVSYLSLVDIADYHAAIREMVRVLAPGGTLLVANLTSFSSAGGDRGWIKDDDGNRLHYPVDRYSEERAIWLAWGGIRIKNWHRPLADYMRAFLNAGLRLVFFDEPAPTGGDEEKSVPYRRVPYFLIMEWRKDAAADP